MKTIFKAMMVVTLATSFTRMAVAEDMGTIRGAGATFPGDVYTAWAFGFSKERKVPLQYQPVGSGEGIKRITARQIDFGATDVPMNAEELKKNGLLQFPTVIGGIVPVVNLKGFHDNLRLSGPVLAKIYMGEINRWNDPEIAALNPSEALPSKAIKRIVRADASGSTATLSEYLAKHSPAWAGKYGGSVLKIEWGGAVEAVSGNRAMVDKLKETDGGIAYVSYQTAKKDALSMVRMRNKSGQFVMPTEQAFLEAVSTSELGKSGIETASLIDMLGTNAWPITDATYILIPRNPTDAERSKKVLSFFYWVFSQGDQMAADTGFVPLPTRVQIRVLARFKEIVGPGGKPIEYLSAADRVSLVSLCRRQLTRFTGFGSTDG